MTDSVVLLEPGDERAKKIGKAMASQTANDILSLLKKGDLTLTEISENMDQPMTTIKYHVENLLQAGLAEVKKIKYSEKGREVKVYGVCEQVVIVSAGTKDIREILMKYASVFGFFIIATLALGLITSSMFSGSVFYDNVGIEEQYTASLLSAGFNESINEYYSAESKILSQPAPVTASLSAANGVIMQSESYAGNFSLEGSRQYDIHSGVNSPEEMIHFIVIAFFLGGCSVLIVLMGYEAIIWRREIKYWNSIKKK